MLKVSEAYKELVNSNIRPKCEPIITVTGIDSRGQELKIVWTANEIKDLSFKRGIDIIGRELPYIELTWTEIYTGKLNVKNYPEKYNNIVKYMAVDLTFKQDLAFHNTWKTLFNGGFSWKKVLKSFSTWENVKNGVAQETLKMPTTFLVDKPVIQGQTITWTARDLLYFLNDNQTKVFNSYGNTDTELVSGVYFTTAIRYLLLNERANFKNSKEVLESLQETQKQISKIGSLQDTLDKNTLVDENTKEAIKDLASLVGYYWVFTENYATVRSIYDLYKRVPSKYYYTFSDNVMYNLPTLTSIPMVSGYSFKQYACEADKSGKYTLTPYDTLTYNGLSFNRFIFKDLGKLTTENNVGVTRSAISEKSTVEVIPYSLNSADLYVNIGNKGEVFAEDNQCNVSGIDSKLTRLKIDNLKRYYGGIYDVGNETLLNENQYYIEISSLANLCLEPDDDVFVETNLYDDNGQVIKRGVITSIEIEYNGAIKQKTTLHTR